MTRATWELVLRCRISSAESVRRIPRVLTHVQRRPQRRARDESIATRSATPRPPAGGRDGHVRTGHGAHAVGAGRSSARDGDHPHSPQPDVHGRVPGRAPPHPLPRASTSSSSTTASAATTTSSGTGTCFGARSPGGVVDRAAVQLLGGEQRRRRTRTRRGARLPQRRHRDARPGMDARNGELGRPSRHRAGRCAAHRAGR